MLMHMTHSRETNSHPFSSPSGGREDQIHVPGSNLLRPLRSFVCHETESRYPSVNPGSGLKEFITHWKLDGSSPVLKPRRISRHLNMEDSCLVDSSETVRKSLRLKTRRIQQHPNRDGASPTYHFPTVASSTDSTPDFRHVFKLS